MNKRLAILSLVSIMAVGSLTACDTGYNYEDGVMLYLNGDAYTTDELYDSYGLNTAAGAKAYYELVNDLIIEADIETTDTMDQIVASQLDSFYDTASDNADTNGTTDSEEVENSLDALGFDSVDELEDSYYLTQKTSKAEDEFYSDDAYEDTFIPEFVEETSPYHVKHILVKVDASSGSYYDATISESDADDISNVVERLATGEDFGTVAQTKSEDTGSAANFGDVGIMSTKTSFVSEFKYGLYTYDAMFNPDTDATTRETVIDKTFPSDTDDIATYENYYNDGAYGIPYSAVKELDFYSDVTKDSSGIDVTDAAETNFPRNILFNNYFNNHALSFIYLDDSTADTTDYYTSDDYSAANDSGRFQNVSGISDNLKSYTADSTGYITTTAGISTSKNILCDEEGRPILVTRAGTGSGDSGYQGIHFIVAQKDPFTTSTSDLEDYYTLDKPSTSSTSDTDGSTYISFINSTNRDVYDTRVDSIKTAVKAMDTNFSYKQFEYYLEEATTEHGLALSEELDTALKSYIAYQRASTEKSTTDSYNESWESYIRSLVEIEDVSDRILPTEKGIEAFMNNDIDNFKTSCASAWGGK